MRSRDSDFYHLVLPSFPESSSSSATRHWKQKECLEGAILLLKCFTPEVSCITSAHLSPVRASRMGKPRCKAGWELQFLIGKLFARDLSIVEKELRLEGHQPTTTHHLVPHNGEKTPRKSCFLFKRKDPSLFFNIYLFIFWLRRVLVVAHRISAVARGFLSSVAHRLQRTGFSSCGVQA